MTASTCAAADSDSEDESSEPPKKELSLGEAYEQLWRVVRLPSVRHPFLHVVVKVSCKITHMA